MNKKAAGLFYLASAMLYLVSAIQIFRYGFSESVVWLCLGSMFLCLGAAEANKVEKTEEEKNTIDSMESTDDASHICEDREDSARQS